MDGDETIPPSEESGTDFTSLIPLETTGSRSGARLPGLAGYENIRQAARGGMGVVYEATQSGLNRKVALKVMSVAGMADDKMRERFRLEAEAVAHLEHPHIVPIYDVGHWENRPFIAMKWVEGSDLNRWMKSRRAEPQSPAELLRETVEKLVKVSEAVHHAHQRGFLHRDLKPSNIMVGKDGTAFVTDFGLARRMGDTEELTLSGQVLGTPSFMSPEQARGDLTSLSVATDVFSLGAILYWVLTGAPPFTGDSVMDVLRKINDEEPARPSTVSEKTDPDLETIALKCLRKEPENRYASAEALAEELRRWLRGEPIAARPATGLERARSFCRRKPITAGLVAAVVVLTLTLIAHLTLSSARLQTELARTSGRLLIEEQQRQLAENSRQQAISQREYAREQEQVARSERTVAVRAGEKLQGHLLRLQLRDAQRNLISGDTARGIAELAAPVRKHPARKGFRQLLAEELGVRSFARRNGWRMEHPQPVTRLIYSPDGSLVITGCADGRIRFFSTASGEQVGSGIQVGSAPVNILDLAGADTLTAAANTNYVCVRLPAGTVSRRGVKRGPNRPFRLSPDEQYLATTVPGGFAIESLVNGVPIQRSKSRPCHIDAWAVDSSYYLSSGVWGQFHIFPTNADPAVAIKLPAKSVVSQFLMLPWSGRFMTVGHGVGAVIWNPKTGTSVRELLHPSIVISAALSPDQSALATGDVAGNIHYWSGTNLVAQLERSRCSGPVRQLAWSPSGNHVFAAGGEPDGGEARVFEAGSGLTSLQGIRWNGLVACDPQFRTVATLSESNIVVGWSVRGNTNGIRFRSMPGVSAVTDLKLSADHKSVAFGTANGITGGVEALTMDRSIGIDNRFNRAPRLAIEPRSRHVIAYDSGKALKMTWKRRSHLLVSAKTVGTILSVDYHKNADRIILISTRGVWEIDHGGKIPRRLKQRNTIWGDYVSLPNHIHLMTDVGVIGAIDADDYGRTVGAWKISPEAINWRNRSLSPDGRWFAGIDADNRLHLFELGSDKHPQDVGAGRIASSVIFGSMSKKLVIFGPNGDASISELDPNPDSDALPLAGRRFVAGAVLEDELVLVTISHDRLLQYWSLTTGLPIRAAIELPYQPLSLAPTRDGRTVFIGDQAGFRRVTVPPVLPMELDAARLAALAENLVGLRQDDQGRFESISLSEAHRNLQDLEHGAQERIESAGANRN